MSDDDTRGERRPDILDFDVQPTPEDIEVLRRMRRQGPRDFEEYLAWLKTLPVDMEALANRKLPIGDPPFSLVDPPEDD